jgi:hypothetical protein
MTLSYFIWILTICVQIGLIVHVIRTGRPWFWVFVLFFAPLIGSAVYFFVEVLPGLSGNPNARNTMRRIRKTLDPRADIRKLEKKHQLSGSVDAARHLAGELIANEHYAEAVEHYQGALTGMYKNDPDLLLGLAEAQFGNKEYAPSKDTLERLAAENPDFRSAKGHLLYSRALEHCEELTRALEEYEAVSGYYAGAEAKYRFANLLEQENQTARALEIYQDILLTADVAPRHFRKAQSVWISKSKDGVKRLAP